MSKLPGLVVVVFALCGSAAAATLQQLNLDQMTQAATAIVRARVIGSSASFTGSTIYTHYKLQVEETWKGLPATEVMVPGGVAAGFRQSYPGVPVLQTGSDYVLFLWTSPKTGITHLVGLNQGIYNVTGQTGGNTSGSTQNTSQSSTGQSSAQVSRPVIGETMLDANGRVVTDKAVQMSLSGMKALVLNRPAAGATK